MRDSFDLGVLVHTVHNRVLKKEFDLSTSTREQFSSSRRQMRSSTLLRLILEGWGRKFDEVAGDVRVANCSVLEGAECKGRPSPRVPCGAISVA